MSTTLDELYDRIAPDIISKPAAEVIRIVEEYPGILDQTAFPDDECRRRTVCMTANYGIVLTEVGRYREALPVIERALLLMVTGSRQPGAWQTPLYENLVYNRGVAASYTGRLKTAGRDFAELARRFPQRDDYRAWGDYVRRQKAGKWTGTAMWGSLASLWSGIVLLWVSDAADLQAHAAAQVMIAGGGALYLILYLMRQKRRKSAKKA